MTHQPLREAPLPQVFSQDPGPRTQDYFYDDYQPVSLLAYINVLLGHYKLIAACLLLAGLSSYVYSRQMTPVYEASTKFITDPNAAKRVFAGSEMYGIETKNPVDYLSNVLKSPAVLDRVLNQSFSNEKTQKLLDLVTRQSQNDLFDSTTEDASADHPSLRLLRARNYFKSDRLTLAATTPRDVSVISLKVQWNDPQMAADLANAFTDELVAYDRSIKTAVSRQKKEAVERLTAETLTRLTEAENKLRDFKLQNRILYVAVLSNGGGAGSGGFVNTSPQLQLERERLEREVQLQSNLYASLKKELDLPKIAESSEASAIVVIERASIPFQRLKPNTRTNVLLAAVVGLMLGIGLAFVHEHVTKFDADTPDAQQFLAHVQHFRHLRLLPWLRKS